MNDSMKLGDEFVKTLVGKRPPLTPLQRLLRDIEQISDPHRRRLARAKVMARVGRPVRDHFTKP